jgi:hypothetical protein
MTSSNTVAGDTGGVIEIEAGDLDTAGLRVEKPMSDEDVSRIGRYWQGVHWARWRDLPFGTTVVINVETGASVSSPSGVSAVLLFEKTFGETAIGWSFDVGRPATVGVGARQWRG